MPKQNKTQSPITIGKPAKFIKAGGVHGLSKVTTIAPPESGRVVVTRKTSGSVELRYVPLEPNPLPPSSTH